MEWNARNVNETFKFLKVSIKLSNIHILALAKMNKYIQKILKHVLNDGSLHSTPSVFMSALFFCACIAKYLIFTTYFHFSRATFKC
jgi:hypothetical protein